MAILVVSDLLAPGFAEVLGKQDTSKHLDLKV